MYISAADNYTFDEARIEVTEKIGEYFETAEIGEGLNRAQIFSLIMMCDSVNNMSLPTSLEDIEIKENEILTVGTLSIREMS